MGYYQERKWQGCGSIPNIFRNRRFNRITSSETLPLLDSNCNFSANHQFDKDYSGDFEDIRKSNCELHRMLDEQRRNIDEQKRNLEKLKKEVANTRSEMRDKIGKEKTEIAATLMAEIRKLKDQITILEGKLDNKIKNTENLVDETVKRPIALEREIKKLKERLIYLELNTIQNMPVESISNESPSGFDQIEEMKESASYDELFIMLITILIFFIGCFIGLQI